MKRKSRKIFSILLPFAIATLVGFTSACPCISIADTADAIAELRSPTELRVGSDVPYGIMEFYDADGNLTGVDIELTRHLAAALNVELDVVTMPFDQLFNALKNGEVDILASAITITPERQESMLFSNPYMDAGMSLAVAAQNNSIQSIADIAGAKVGILKGTVGEKLADSSTKFSQSLLVRFSDNEKRMQALLNGSIDAAIVHFLVTDETSIRLVGEPLSQSFYGLVTRLENTNLIETVNQMLRQLKRDNAINAMKKKFTVMQE
ncbi:MAG: ABC transporter substrate-binding protein [Pseudomonadota bacterium]